MTLEKLTFDELKLWLWGSVKSATVWFGGILILAPVWWPQIEPTMMDWFGIEVAQYGAQIVGLLAILLRMKTTKSLPEKAVAPVEDNA